MVTLCWAQVVAAGETITFFHNEIVGSPAVATDVNGFQVWKETYRPYGDQLIDSAAADNNEIWYAGKPFDDSTGLSYMGARYYDPTLGRFMAVDPVSFNFDNLHSFNRYAYANNNPYMYVDPDGEAAQVAVVAVGAAVLVVGGGCVAAGSCENFGRAVWKFGIAVNERFGMPLLGAALVASGRFLSEGKESGDTGEGSGDSGEGGDKERVDRPPTGSKPISETPWSGDHGKIKEQVDAGADDNVSISPNGEVWRQNPDGSWTNFGKAGALTGSGQASGQSGKERDRKREEQRERRREKRNQDDER